jgi:MFS family permease
VSAHEDGELRPAYRTLDDPTRLLGLPLGGWAAALLAGGAAYGWLMLSPLGWRANLSLVIVGIGAPLALALLREQSTISIGRLLIAVVRWRTRTALITPPTQACRVRRGGVRLDESAPPVVLDELADIDVPWPNGPEDEVPS